MYNKIILQALILEKLTSIFLLVSGLQHITALHNVTFKKFTSIYVVLAKTENKVHSETVNKPTIFT